MRQYEVQNIIGSGAQGLVLLCKHKLSNLQYAIKVIDKKKNLQILNGSEEDFDEVKLMIYAAKKQLKNVVSAVQVYDHDKHFAHVVTEYY